MPLTVNDEQSARDLVTMAKSQGYPKARHFWDGKEWRVIYGTTQREDVGEMAWVG